MSTEDLDDNVDDLNADQSNTDTDNEGHNEEVDILSMSDDDLESYFEKASNKAADTDNEGDSADDDKDADNTEDADDESDDNDSDDDGTAEDDENDTDDNSGKTDDSEDTDDATDSKKEADSKDEKDDDQAATDYEAQITELLAPFRANGREIKVDSVADARKLMQMGANYNKNMRGIKPLRKIGKMLEENGLLDETKLSHLIDVSKKDPKAIAKLLADANIDPDDLNVAKPDYKPTDHSVSDEQVNLDEALDSISDSTTHQRTIDTISNKWDAKSRATILNAPEIIPLIDSHMQSGIFDKIVTEMDTDRMLGKLDGLSDIEAYKAVGDRLQKAGKLTTQDADTNSNKKGPSKKVSKKAEAKRTDKRKAASSTKSTQGKKKVKIATQNPLAMSDEDFSKISIPGLY